MYEGFKREEIGMWRGENEREVMREREKRREEKGGWLTDIYIISRKLE